VDVALIHSHKKLPAGLTLLEEPTLDCSLGASGGALMQRKDNPLLEWWDPAQERFIQTSEYRRICQDIKEEHGMILVSEATVHGQHFCVCTFFSHNPL